jgi:hypothetical protein
MMCRTPCRLQLSSPGWFMCVGVGESAGAALLLMLVNSLGRVGHMDRLAVASRCALIAVTGLPGPIIGRGGHFYM